MSELSDYTPYLEPHEAEAARRVHEVGFMNKFEQHVQDQAAEIVEDFRRINDDPDLSGSVPSGQRHFCFYEDMHRHVYMHVATQLGIYTDLEDAQAALLAPPTPREVAVAQSTPEDKVALVRSIRPVEAEGFENFAVVIAKHLETDGSTYAISIEPAKLQEWPSTLE